MSLAPCAVQAAPTSLDQESEAEPQHDARMNQMSELLGWMIVVGLAVVVAAVYMLSTQIEKQTRTTLEFLLHSNEMIIARLERTHGPLVQGEKPADGVAPEERRRMQRRNPLTGMLCAAGGDHRRALPRRRLEDLVQN